MTDKTLVGVSFGGMPIAFGVWQGSAFAGCFAFFFSVLCLFCVGEIIEALEKK